MNDIHSLSDAYVVGAVTPAEAHEFEAHLLDCASCTAELAELRHITARLSEAVATDAPPSLRANILAMIAATPQEQPLRANLRAESTTPASGATNEVEPSSVVPPSAAETDVSGRHLAAVPPSTEQRVPPTRREGPQRRWSALLVAAAVVAAIGFGGWALQSRDAASDLTAQNEQIHQQNQEFTELLSAGDVRAVSGEFSEGGTGSVVMSRSEGTALLVAADLPDLPADKVYEAWTIKGSPVPAGLFSDADSGSVIELPQAVFDAQSVAVTVEPAGGSDRPTSDAIFSVTIPQS